MTEKLYPERTSEEPTGLAWWAARVLRQNDAGGWTKPGPNHYPHQWSWDSAFIAIGLARFDVRRAARELETLFAHQWASGKVPHIVFDPKAPPGSYLPGAEHWTCAVVSSGAPPNTSGLCQPPVHAIAALRIWEVAKGMKEVSFAYDFLRGIYPRLLSWHRYLMTFRDPEGSGLITIYHPWESGTDNSPR
jgi:glucosylglycerate hydrolase